MGLSNSTPGIRIWVPVVSLFGRQFQKHSERVGKGEKKEKTASKVFIDEQVTTMGSWSSNLLKTL